MPVESIDTVAGIRIPDSALARDVTEFIRDAEDDVLYHHSRRVFFFGAVRGEHLGLQPDLELLYAAAMFHDLGLTERYRDSGIRFEVDGAEAARDFLVARGFGEVNANTVWLGIALHTTPGVPDFLAPEVALLQKGVEVDVLGVGREQLAADELAAITAAHPRPDFKQRILAAFNDGMRHRPQTTFGTMNDDVLAHFDATFQRVDFVEEILRSSWPE